MPPVPVPGCAGPGCAGWQDQTDEPCLNFVEGLQLWDGHKHDDRLFPTTHIHLACGGDLEGAQLHFEVGHAVLEIEERLRNGRFGLIGWGCWRIRRTNDFVLQGHDKALFFLAG